MVNSAANSYKAIYGRGQGKDMEEYEVTFTSGGYNAQGKPQNAVVSSIEEFESMGRWRKITTDNVVYAQLVSNTFVAKMQQVA